MAQATFRSRAVCRSLLIHCLLIPLMFLLFCYCLFINYFGGGSSSHIINNAYSALSVCVNILLRYIELIAGCCNLNYVLLSSGCRCYACVSFSLCQSLVCGPWLLHSLVILTCIFIQSTLLH